MTSLAANIAPTYVRETNISNLIWSPCLTVVSLSIRKIPMKIHGKTHLKHQYDRFDNSADLTEENYCSRKALVFLLQDGAPLLFTSYNVGEARRDFNRVHRECNINLKVDAQREENPFRSLRPIRYISFIITSTWRQPVTDVPSNSDARGTRAYQYLQISQTLISFALNKQTLL